MCDAEILDGSRISTCQVPNMGFNIHLVSRFAPVHLIFALPPNIPHCVSHPWMRCRLYPKVSCAKSRRSNVLLQHLNQVTDSLAGVGFLGTVTHCLIKRWPQPPGKAPSLGADLCNGKVCHHRSGRACHLSLTHLGRLFNVYREDH